MLLTQSWVMAVIFVLLAPGAFRVFKEASCVSSSSMTLCAISDYFCHVPIALRALTYAHSYGCGCLAVMTTSLREA